MKVLGLREAKQSLSMCIEQAQKDRVLITRHGKPAAVLIGVAGQEMDDVILQMDPRFWEMIEERRRKSSTVSIEEVRARYSPRAKGRRKRRS